MARKKNRKRKRRRDKGDRRDEQASSKKLTEEVRDEIEEWAEEASQAHGLTLFDVEPTVRGRWIIRVYVERPGEPGEGEGVEVDECAEVSRYMEAYLDADDRIPENYVLEVSSPGLERPLKKPKHFRQAVGERVQVVTREQIDGKNKVVGTLLSFEDDTLELELESLDEPVEVKRDDIARARLKHEF